MAYSKKRMSKRRGKTMKRNTAGATVPRTDALGNPLKDANGNVLKCIDANGDDRLGSSVGLRPKLPSCILVGGKRRRRRSKKNMKTSSLRKK